MSQSCVFTPSKGKGLYKSLTKQLGHEVGTKLFLASISPSFQRTIGRNLKLDENSVPELDSLLSNPEVHTLIGKANVVKLIHNELKKTTFPLTEEGFNEALSNADQFNTSSIFSNQYTVIPYETGDSYTLGIYKKEVAFREYKRMKLTKVLKERAMGIFSDTPITFDMFSDFVSNFGDNHKFNPVRIALTSLSDALNGNPTTSQSLNYVQSFIAEAYSDEPLVKRLEHFILSEDAVYDILETPEAEKEDYPTQEEITLAVGKVLLGNKGNWESEAPIIDRAINKVRESLSTIDTGDIVETIDSVESDNSIVVENTNAALNTENVTSIQEITERNLTKMDNDLKKLNTFIKKLKALEVKRIKLHNEGIDALSILQSKQHNVGEKVKRYIEASVARIKEYSDKMQNMEELSLREKCDLISDILKYSRTYSIIVEQLDDILNSKDNEVIKELIKNIPELSRLTETITSENLKLFNDARKYASIFFTEFLKPLVGESFTFTLGENAGKTMSISELLENMGDDIGVVSRLLDSASNTNDIVLQGAHKIIKKQKDRVRFKTIEMHNRIRKMHLEAEQVGLKDLSFMYEKVDGKRTGRYINQIDSYEWRNSLNTYLTERHLDRESIEAIEDIEEKNAAIEERDSLVLEWHKENSTLISDGWVPNPEKWESEAFKALSPAQKKYHKEFMAIKKELDKLLPDWIDNDNAIVIRKALSERMLKGGENSNIWRSIQMTVKDALTVRSDESERGSVLFNTDLENKPVKTPPIYFVGMKKGESAEDLTDYLSDALSAYAYMAYNYSAMNEISSALELGREVMAQRKGNVSFKGKPVKSLTRGFKVTHSENVTEIAKNAAEVYDNLMESQVYGIYIKDSGTVGKTNIDKQKLSGLALRIGSSIQLGLNSLAGIANAVNGLAMQNIEAAAREFYNAKELLAADKYYAKHLPKLLGELGSRSKSNVLDLIFQYFDIKQDFDKTRGSLDKKSFILKMFGPSILYLYQTSGDHFLYGRGSLAMLLREQVNYKGKKTSLLEAITENLKFIDKNKPNLGKKVSLEGITKLDGSAYTEDDVSVISRKIERVNQKCFGVYNKGDINAARRVILGKFALQYRDWMRPAWKRRFASAHMDVELGYEIEGYYTSLKEYSKLLFDDLKKGQLNIIQNYRNLTEHQKANVRRVITEVAQFISVLGLLTGINWDVDDEDKSWALSMLEYTLRRQQTELGALIPGPYMITEGFNILKSPAANINVIESTADLMKLLWPSNYMDEIQSGRFKGHSSAYRTFFNSPLGLQSKNIIRTIDPSESIEYQKNISK